MPRNPSVRRAQSRAVNCIARLRAGSAFSGVSRFFFATACPPYIAVTRLSTWRGYKRCNRLTSYWRYPMALERPEVEKIAHLARLDLNEADLPRTTETLNNILGLIDRMQAVDTNGVEPLAHPLETTQRLRRDEVTETSQRDAYQAIAPAVEDGLYLVPRVIE